MFLRILKGRKGLFSRLATKKRLANVLSVTELEQAFHRERARVDRNEKVFALVVFTPAVRLPDATPNLSATLQDRLRASDTIGMRDAERVAVLLPETNSEGAWCYADDVLERVAADNLNFNCEVYCYPGDWSERQSDDQGVLGSGTDGAPVGPRSTNGVARAVRPDDGLARVRMSGPRPVGDLSPLFLQPLHPGKRLVDILVSATLLLLLSPLLIVTAILIKASSPGPVIFKQLRAGRGGKPFYFFKFRSMYLDAEERRAALQQSNEASGPVFKMRNDPRMTPIGRLLRRSSIDELPQLWNVLRGDMPLIGPRPPTMDEVPNYEPWQRNRLNAKGGLTCIWQVSGRSEIGFDEWVRMDLRYLATRSFWLDLKLLFKTVSAVLSGRGAY